MTFLDGTLLHFHCKRHERLRHENLDQTSLSFIKKRIRHGFPGCRTIFTVGDLSIQPSFVDEGVRRKINVSISLMNPLLDLKLLREMLEISCENDRVVVATGMVPGTEVEWVSTGEAGVQEKFEVIWGTQVKYGTQVNLGRLKRAKIFLALCKKFPALHEMSVEDILDFCGTPAGVRTILGFGEAVDLDYYDNCPHCRCKHVYPVSTSSGHSVMGFLTTESKYYYSCGQCGLVFLNPVMKNEDLHLMYGDFETERPFIIEKPGEILHDVNERNTSHFYNYKTALDVWGGRLPPNAHCLDMGGGEGGFCAYLKKRFPQFSVSLLDFNVKEVKGPLAEIGVAANSGDLLRENIGADRYDLITMWEVIEHLRVESLSPMIEKIAASLRRGGFFVLSTPDFHDPYCHALDFWAMAPGQHITVLSRRFLEPLLKSHGLRIVGEEHECVTTKTGGRWFAYGARHHRSLSARAEASLIEDVLNEPDLADRLRMSMKLSNRGSELILCAEKL